MDSSENKIWIGWLAFLFLIMHFGLVISYAMPEVLGNKALKEFSTPYVEPIFTQKWSMFAPCPTINAHVQVKFYFEDDSTDWMSPTESAQKKHSWFRMSHHGELVLGESNLAYWLELDMDQMEIEIGDEFPREGLSDFQQGYSYFKVKNYLRGNALHLYEKSLVKGKIRFDLEDVVTAEKGTLELPPFLY